MRKLLILAAVVMLAGCKKTEHLPTINGSTLTGLSAQVSFSTGTFAVNGSSMVAVVTYHPTQREVTRYLFKHAKPNDTLRHFVDFEDSDGNKWLTELPSRGTKERP